MITIIVLTIIIILLILCIGVITVRYNKLKKEYRVLRYNNLNERTTLSMIEYHYRKFKEGQNAYTVLRDMSNVLRDYYPELNNKE